MTSPLWLSAARACSETWSACVSEAGCITAANGSDSGLGAEGRVLTPRDSVMYPITLMLLTVIATSAMARRLFLYRRLTERLDFTLDGLIAFPDLVTSGGERDRPHEASVTYRWESYKNTLLVSVSIIDARWHHARRFPARRSARTSGRPSALKALRSCWSTSAHVETRPGPRLSQQPVGARQRRTARPVLYWRSGSPP